MLRGLESTGRSFVRGAIVGLRDTAWQGTWAEMAGHSVIASYYGLGSVWRNDEDLQGGDVDSSRRDSVFKVRQLTAIIQNGDIP